MTGRRTDRFDLVALAVLGVGSPLLLVCLLVPAPWTVWGLIALVTAFPVALAALGAGRKAGPRRFGPVLALLFALLAGSLGAIRWLTGSGATIGGLPAGLAVMLGGLGLATFVVTSLAFVAAFRGD